MAFCTKCGKQIEENSRFCPYCGASFGEPQAASPVQQKAPSESDHTAEYEQDDIKENKAISVLSYFGPLFIVPLIATPNSKFARFHANQGLVLFALELIYGCFYSFLSFLLASIFKTSLLGASVAYTLILLPFSLVWIFLLVMTVIGIVNTAKGKAQDVPCFGKFRFFK